MDFLTLSFFLNSALIGVGLSMDAFSISLTNGLAEPKMRFGKVSLIAGIFAFCQAAMPLIGWVCVHTIAEQFAVFNKLIPWIALVLLGYIGGHMLIEAIKCNGDEACSISKVSFVALIVQGIATSIDALSVGFTISDYNFIEALTSALIISAVTFIICTAGVIIGKKFGNHLAGKAGILGGVILIFIGLKIFIEGVF